MSNNIIREEHDFNRINIEAADVDRGLQALAGIPVWDASEYGITREEAERRVREAATPEARARVLADLRDRAVQRADLATTDGKIAFAGVGTAAWHGLGVSVSTAMTSAEAIKLGGQDYLVEKFPVQAKLDFGGIEQVADVPNVWAVGRRSRSGNAVSIFPGVTVSDQYRLVQNHECFEFMDEVLQSNGAHYDTVGAIAHGRKIWLSALMPQVAEPVRGDEVRNYLVLTNSHDGTEALQVFSTDHRIVCGNTRRQAIARRSNGISIRHTGNIKAKVAEAQIALGIVRDRFVKYAEDLQRLVRIGCNPMDLINPVLDEWQPVIRITADEMMMDPEDIIGPRATASDHKAYDRLVQSVLKAKDKRYEILTKIMNRYESKTNTAPGSVYAAFQAVTEYANHDLRYKGEGKDDRRFQSLLTGRADGLNQLAWTQALELAS